MTATPTRPGARPDRRPGVRRTFRDGPLRQEWATRPRIALALKAATAAAAAWLLIQPFGGLVGDYQYYAPFGAVVAVSSTVARSLRSTVQAAGAIAIGATTALTVRELPLPEVVALALVVAIGTGAAGWRRLGPMGSWVPVSALFILILGDRDPSRYVIAYLGLTTLGGLVGIGVNMAFPSLPLAPTRLALRQVRTELAQQLDDVAAGLRQTTPPTLEEWRQRRRVLGPHLDRMRGLVAEAAEARRVNWRARRWRDQADRQHAMALVLEQLTALTDQVVGLVVERERTGRSEPALGPSLRPLTAAAVSATAALLETLEDGPDRVEPALRRTRAAVEELRHATSTAWHDAGEDRYTAAALVTALERAVDGLQGAVAGE